MKSTFLTAIFAATMAASMPSFAVDDSDRPDHFKGKPSATLAEALANLQEYNQRLSDILDGELTPQKMAEIHQLTYTLEVALERIDDEVDTMKDTLEEVHLGSELMNFERVKVNGVKYLEASNQLVEGAQ